MLNKKTHFETYMVKVFFLVVLVSLFFSNEIYCQTGGSFVGGPEPSELIAESLHQAVSLEKLPEVTLLFLTDTIYIATFDLYSDSPSDTEISSFLSGELPSHVSKWWIKPLSAIDLNEQDEGFYYIKLFINRDEEVFTVDLICQPNASDFIDRGRITLTYKYKKGVFELQTLVRWYG